jgi:CheY-like chemotaxis protein
MERAKCSVLVADDHTGIRGFVQQVLELEGFARVDTVATGLAAVAAWEHGAYDLLLFDWQMPGLDGVEATRRIRGLERELARPRTPIVMMTGWTSEADLAACRAAGADECVGKPYKPEELIEAIDRTLRSRKRGDRTPAG